MISQIIGAIARAIFVILLIATPALLLPNVSRDTTQIVTLVALFAAAFTLFEYATAYPSLTEFRYAPPFNRMRFVALFSIVFLLSIVFRGDSDTSALAGLVRAIGALVGQMIDVPFTPWRMLTNSLSGSLAPQDLAMLRSAVGISYVISLVMIVVFIVVMRVSNWPVTQGTFNFWINLPLFDPTTGGDVVTRLNWDARVNFGFALVLPFIVPGLAKLGIGMFDPERFLTPQPLVWIFALWAFLPASLVMRGIALKRVAQMISDQRRAQRAIQEQGRLQPV